MYAVTAAQKSPKECQKMEENGPVQLILQVTDGELTLSRNNSQTKLGENNWERLKTFIKYQELRTEVSWKNGLTCLKFGFLMFPDVFQALLLRKRSCPIDHISF